MLLGQRYNAAVDWWAFGVILYTMATGEFPFYCGNTSETLVASVLQDTLSYPECLSTVTQDILKKLLLKEPAMRLGRKGLIRSHSFFQSIDWEELEAGRVEPPFTLSTFVQKARLGAGPGRRAERQPSELAPAMGRINIRK
ncbi:kinase C theta type-like [Pelobates cultripes]|uniref:Kinase C theta type-like, partial n=1 Tax=Pelobates cultripes TaxID=61616 RepID=A0AAD1TR38_PELCU|nr:kinase C theta type-like [Pelobates cultripes]